MRFFDPESRPKGGWRANVYTVIFETDTRAGLIFDVVLLVAIMLSIAAISLETVTFFEHSHRQALRRIEWILTILFTIEYIMRLVVVQQPKRYALSFMGIVDLLSLLPTYLSLFFMDTQALQIVRALRLFRVFRVFQLGRMTAEGSSLVRALITSRYKITVFLGTLLIIVVIQGALLYYVEHRVNDGFSSIPRSVYWAIVTLTTVGYGDISPVTVPGQFIASILMLLGYGIIAVPTGIVTAEIAVQEMTDRKAEAEAEIFDPRPDDTQCGGVMPPGTVIRGPIHASATTLHSITPAPAPALEPEPEPEPEPAAEPEPDTKPEEPS